MTHPRARVEALFENALEMPPTQRRLWLAIACADEPALEADVLSLLAAHEKAGILDLGAASIARKLDTGSEPEPARAIGPYKIIQELGRGGMGVVYLASREDGQFRRRVALKLLRGSPDAEELHGRFLAERQILAALQHPNIAALLDGGVADGRMPYLVMEYVEGDPITGYCDRRQLGLQSRVRLFLDVCSAVHHAHKNLVLHRDLKPGNMLVTDNGQVKLLDFGIAKLLNPVLSGVEQPVTRAEDRVLTPEYASPEQIRGEPLSTASDVYALGVVLYELLTGASPYRVSTRSPHELTTLICEREPERPSAAVARTAEAGRIAAARGSSPQKMQRELRGDLDAIVLMALRKEPLRRYGSAELLAQDIARYLEGRPVLAQRGSRRYRTAKFLRRHRVEVGATALVLVTAMVGAGAATWQGNLARVEKDRAEAALTEARQALLQSEEITRYLTLLFEANDPAQAQGTELTARDLLRRGIRQADQLNGQPLVQAAMFDVLGRVQTSLGEYPEARRLFERSLEVRIRQRGERHADVASTLYELANTQARAGLYPEAEVSSRKALQIYESLPTPDPADLSRVASQISSLAVYRGDLNEAEAFGRRGVTESERAAPEDGAIRVRSRIQLGSIERRQGKYREAEATFRSALGLGQRLLGPDHPLTIEPEMHLGYLLAEQPLRFREAESVFRSAIEARRRVLGADHQMYAYSLNDLARLIQQQGRHDEALPLFRQAYEIIERALGPSHPLLADAKGTFAAALGRAGQNAEAERLFRESVALAEQRYGPEHSATAGAMSGLATVLMQRGRIAEAERMIRRAIAIRTTLGGPNTPLMAVMNGNLAEILIEKGSFAEAELALRQAVNVFEKNHIPPQQHDYRLVLSRFVALYEAWGRPDRAAEMRARLATME